MVGVGLQIKQTIKNCDYLSALSMFAFLRSFDFQIIARENNLYFLQL